MPENEKLPSPINLKHRIIGAVILVSLAVIFLPMILSEREPPAELKAISEIPGKGSAPGDSRDDAKEGGGRATPGAVSRTAAEKPAPVSEYTLPEPPPEPAAPPAPEKKAAAAAVPDKAPANGARPARGWVVQVGIFANAANATRLGERLRKQGHEVMIDNVTQNSDQRVRLRVGPFADKNAAQQVQARIRQDAGVPGAVLPYP